MSSTDAIIGLVGVLIGGLIYHWLSASRDSAARKRAFIGFLKQWRSEIDCSTQSVWGSGCNTSAELAYQARLASFHSEVEGARDVFSDAQRFKDLTGKLGSLKAQDWHKKQPHDVILKVLDELRSL